MNAMHNAPASDPSLVYPSPLKEFWQAFAHNKGALGGLLFMLLIVFCALFAPPPPGSPPTIRASSSGTSC